MSEVHDPSADNRPSEAQGGDHRDRSSSPNAHNAKAVLHQPQGREPSEFGEYGMHAGKSGDKNLQSGADAGRAGAPVSPLEGHAADLAEGNSKTASYGSSDHGAPTDHQSFDAEYRIREERNHKARSLPTGLSEAPSDGAAVDPAGAQPHHNRR